MKKPLGVILYQGPSVLDGKMIVVVMTFKTSNRKTGQMAQVWILVDDMDPVAAFRVGADSSVCGNCPQRWYHGGACYVNLGQAPNSIWKAVKRGSYPMYNSVDHDQYIVGTKVRFGAYGDPAAVPFEVLSNIADMSSGYTGYTHQARHKNFDSRIANICQISIETARQAERTTTGYFRVIADKSEALETEIECLADSKGLSCADCLKCDGKSNAKVYIQAHGSRAKRHMNNNLIAVG